MSDPMNRVFILVCTLILNALGCLSVSSAPLDDLARLFESDPATAFEQAQEACRAAVEDGDLPRAMEVFRLVLAHSDEYHHWATVDAIAAQAIPLAEANGDWASVADLYEARAKSVVACGYHSWGGKKRFAKFIDATRAARAKAGMKAIVPFEALYRQACKDTESDPAVAAATYPSPELASALRNMARAWGEMQDAGLVDAASRFLDLMAASMEGNPDHDTVWGYTNDIAGAGFYIIMTSGAEGLIPSFRALVDQYGDLNNGGMVLLLPMDACRYRWSGRDDVFRDTFYWCLTHFRPSRHQPPASEISFFCQKLIAFRRYREAEQLIGRLLEMDRVRRTDRPDSYLHSTAHGMIWPGIPDDLRRQVVLAARRDLADSLRLPLFRIGRDDMALLNGYARCIGEIVAKAPPAARETWALEAAWDVADAATTMPGPDLRSAGLLRAAGLYDSANRPDLAEQCRALAKAITESDPKAALQLALTSARALASEGKWEDVARALEEPTATGESCRETLQAALLLHGAYLRTGRRDDAERWFTRAHQLVHSLPLSAAEKANYLVSMAALCDLATGDAACIERKAFLLQQAEAAAKEAGLDLLQEKISSQLADVSLVGGDLETAKAALIQIVDRTETRREQLAFDPVLRQHWFADNIGPYRKLMRVAALTNDPLLALSCAERMRARALVDQLSWQKVDMAVNLAPETQERLKRLRAMRNEAYGLLQQALGGGKPEVETDDLRGKYMPIRGQYMPIRGMYMPIRGPLDRNVLASEADIAHLKELLGKLASEEAAIESAVREQVPAYEMASATRVPTGQEIADAVAAHPKLGVLHYTFTDQGLAVVAMGPGGGPKVAHIEVSGDALWERIGKFREMIWERKVEAFQEAADLFTLLVLPVYGVLPGAERVWVIADGALQLVPFGALLGLDKVFLAYHCAVATAPSLSLALASRGERPAAGKPALVVAAPDTGALSLAGDDTRGKYMPIRGMYMPIRGAYMPIRGEEGVSGALTAMAMIPLPGAKAEGEAIADMIPGSELVSGKAATKERLLTEGSDCGLLHIATHGYADPDFPEFSGLLLASGDDVKPYDVLTAQEVYTWPLKARLVTLSACQTALGKDVEGEGLLGLSRAFIYAGAQDVLCSLWPVSDESTKTLMTAFYKGLAEGQSVEDALRSAQRALMQVTETNHPFFWAGFTAVRGPE